jgi:hypothetical protein
MLRKIFNLSASITTVAFTVTITTPALAGTRYVSLDGNLTVEYSNACSTTTPSGSYRVRNGVSGDLVATTCEGIGGDVGISRFTDTSGDERCYGRMTQSWGRRVMTVWQVEGAVSGYSCSQTGKRFEVEMDDGQQI